MDLLAEWASAEEDARSEKFNGYVHGIAQARYIVRKVWRFVDEEARKVGLEPLQHQALLQAFGAGPAPLTIGKLAERLDIVPALASRTVKELAQLGLVTRTRRPDDKRVITVIVTEPGRDLLRAIDAAVHVHVEYFHSTLTDEQRRAALVILTFYAGLGSRSRLSAIMTADMSNS
ncbi:MarR family winged helix-turn-helix transcriptional regulator [Pseudonocardia sp. MH-G8]|uniref:MarR family winged helix-turn-helix transcriptional regulator n=1 Tax=Pseudonocardia sp. MH-G8 TaxID=1854588 RepID=UPI00117B9811|nr:MarR family transcriptional regulator [Pseudonocardia sp. MH-G8]